MSNEFNPGDLVSLKSGGPVMTVQSVGDGRVIATWFDDTDKRHKEEFHHYEIEHNDGMPPMPVLG